MANDIIQLPFQPELRSWPERSCDALSQKGAGDALVASCGSDYPAAGKNATGASLSPCGDEASPLLSAGRFGVRVQNTRLKLERANHWVKQ
jgi:hypothetical protein